MFHTYRYSGASLIKLIELLPAENMLQFLKTHQEAISQIKSSDEAIACIVTVLEKLDTVHTGNKPEDKKNAIESINFILDCFKPLLLSSFTYQDFRLLLSKIVDDKKYHNINLIVLNNLENDLVRFMRHTVTDADKLAEIIPLLYASDKIKTVNEQDAYWARQERCTAFLSGSECKESSIHFLFSQDKEFKLRKKILQYTEELDSVDTNQMFLKK